MGARIRSIKPELWQDEQLGQLPIHAQLLFIGLISHADDEGRLRGNPLLIGAQVFPYRPEIDVEDGLRHLERAGRIVRYSVDGQAFIWVCRFTEHQKIDKPKPSALPPPPEPGAARLVADASPTHPRHVADESPQEGSGREGNGSGVEGIAPLLSESAAASSSLQSLWNSEAHPDLPRWRESSPDRRRVEKARLKERPLPEWRLVVQRINASAFCRGQNDRGWKATPDWLLKAGTAAKVLEGKYDDAPAKTGPPKRDFPPCQILGCAEANSSGLGLCSPHLDEFKADPETQRLPDQAARFDFIHTWISDRNARSAA